MALKISNNSLLAKNYLSVDSGGVQFADTSIFGTKRFTFRSIECVLLSPDHKLSFQVGNGVYSIPTQPGNADHQAVIHALLQEVRRSAAGGSA
jgi:hypothetical protein